MVNFLALGEKMGVIIDHGASSLNDEQALALMAAFHRLMEFDIAVRSGQYLDIEPDHITLTIGMMVKVFSYMNDQLENMFESSNFRNNALMRMDMIMSDMNLAHESKAN